VHDRELAVAGLRRVRDRRALIAVPSTRALDRPVLLVGASQAATMLLFVSSTKPRPAAKRDLPAVDGAALRGC
jgi:hypothetical protein